MAWPHDLIHSHLRPSRSHAKSTRVSPMPRQHVRTYHEAQRPHPSQGSSAVPVTGGGRAAAAAARGGSAEPARPAAGNLESFVAHVTPHVKLQFLPQDWDEHHSDRRHPKQPRAATPAPFFALSDVWDALEECSAYSAAVPLLLPSGAPATQHYAPSISGLQLFSRLPAPPSPHALRLHAHSPLEQQPSLASSLHSPPSPWEGYLEEGGNGTCEGTVDSWCCDCSGGQPLLEFFERAPPHSRPPLFAKVVELERDCALRRRTSSFQLHPRSWMAIAWYPVYSIPMGPTAQDLAASFLTFHSLSSPLPSSSGSCTRCRDRFWIAPSSLSPSHPIKQLNQLPGRLSSDYSAARAGEGRPGGALTAALVPFGFAGYKTWGTVWSDRGAVQGLESAAAQWLRQIDATLPDHAFFSMQR
ncbi:hypothetical protein CLOM_g1371 [Closterium sp. NIES-68]|nr:hypothetical protein CLOM_g1371 [Closterium sp. NIES-68]